MILCYRFTNLLILLALFVFAGSANAENLRYQPLVVLGHCSDTTDYITMLNEQYGEIPILKGRAFVQVPAEYDGEIAIVEGVLVITTNYKSNTYSVSITFDNDTTCSIINGGNFFPWDFEEPKKEKL